MNSSSKTRSAVNMLSSAVLIMMTSLCALPAMAEESDKDCIVLCAPELNFEPTLTVENLFAPPRVRNINTNEVIRRSRESAFEIVLALDVPTVFPYVGFTLETIFPVSSDNSLEFEVELNLNILLKEWTRGWLGSHFDVIMKLSPRETPGGESAYTPKLNLELDVGFYAFNWLSDGNWLRGVSIETSLDYVASGLPGKGAEMDEDRYLDPASGWSISFLLVVPVAPMSR